MVHPHGCRFRQTAAGLLRNGEPPGERTRWGCLSGFISGIGVAGVSAKRDLRKRELPGVVREFVGLGREL